MKAQHFDEIIYCHVESPLYFVSIIFISLYSPQSVRAKLATGYMIVVIYHLRF